MAKSSQFRAKLRQCDPEIRQYIVTLEGHNLRLQRQVGRLEANSITAHNRIKALERAINADSSSPTRISVTALSEETEPQHLSEEAKGKIYFAAPR